MTPKMRFVPGKRADYRLLQNDYMQTQVFWYRSALASLTCLRLVISGEAGFSKDV